MRFGLRWNILRMIDVAPRWAREAWLMIPPILHTAIAHLAAMSFPGIFVDIRPGLPRFPSFE
jgi:hypothetical protein